MTSDGAFYILFLACFRGFYKKYNYRFYLCAINDKENIHTTLPEEPFYEMSKTTLTHTFILLVVCIAAFFINNDVFPTDIMESRNIVTAREMVYDGHWMVPTMNGELRLEKPPLPTWLTAVAEMAMPGSLAAHRAIAGLGAMLLVFFFYKIGRKLTGDSRYALIATLVLCTLHPIVLMGRTATWDIWCHAFMTGAIYYLINILRKDRASTSNALMCGAMMGLSFMSKGPVSFYALLLPFIISYVIYSRHDFRGKGRYFFYIAVTAILVGLWWYAYILVFETDTARQIFDKESGAWVNHNVRPWYYYITFFLESGIWAVVLLCTLAVPFWKKIMGRERRQYLFSITWMIAVILLLSFLPEKKNRYLLPMLIPAGYAIGFVVYNWGQTLYSDMKTSISSRVFRANAFLMAVVIICSPVVAYFILNSGENGYHLSLLQMIPVMIVGGTMFYSAIKLRPYIWLGCIVILFAMIETLYMPLIKQGVSNPDFYSLAHLNDKKELTSLPIRNDDSGEPLRIEMVYEVGRTITPICITDSIEMRNSLPCILISNNSIEDAIPASILKTIDITPLGKFDNNRRAGKYFREMFVFNAALLKKKER